MTEAKNSYKPAWKDRIGLNDRWRKDLDLCSETYGTSEYIDRVECLRNDLINIKDGPQLVDTVNEFVDGKLTDWKAGGLTFWKSESPELADDPDLVLKIKKEINLEASKRLHHFILQLLENEGFGMYKSDMKEDDIGLND
ncbi:MAG: hypothetical protein GF375_00905 [Candidatus Omnitrophica bacterium]|nr:hypothetical protein [Candidatus Omnitrophota bacterium]